MYAQWCDLRPWGDHENSLPNLVSTENEFYWEPEKGHYSIYIYLGPHHPPGPLPMPTCSQCTMGRWTCTEQPCPGHCSLEGGSFVTTFDARPYRFHGTCTYTLLQVGGAPGLGREGNSVPIHSPLPHSLTSLEPAATQQWHPPGCVRQVRLLTFRDLPSVCHLPVQEGKATCPESSTRWGPWLTDLASGSCFSYSLLALLCPSRTKL